MKKTLLLFLFVPICQAGVKLPDGGWHYQYNLDLDDQIYLKITYFSRSTHRSELGLGWCGPWVGQIDRVQPEQYRVLFCGKQIYFTPENSAPGIEKVWRSSLNDELRIFDGGYRVFAKDMTVYEFNKLGRLVAIQKQGQSQRVQYDALGRVKAFHLGITVLLFEYKNLDTSVSQIRRSEKLAGPKFVFSSGNLTEILSQKTWAKFKYDEFDNLDLIESSDNPPLNIDYDKFNDRVIKVEQNKCVQRFEYKTNYLEKVIELKKSSRCLGLEPISQTFQFTYAPIEGMKEVRVTKTSASETSQKSYRFDNYPKRSISNMGDYQ